MTAAELANVIAADALGEKYIVMAAEQFYSGQSQEQLLAMALQLACERIAELEAAGFDRSATLARAQQNKAAEGPTHL